MKTNYAMPFLRAAVLLAVALTGASLAQAQSRNVSWTGNAGNGAWSTAGNWSTNQVPGSTSDVCISSATVDATATRSISVDSIQLAEGSSPLLFGSGNVSIATSLTSQGFITLYGTTLSAASISLPAPGEIDIYDNSSITSPTFSNTGTVSVGTGGTLQLADNPVQLQNGTLSGGSWLVSGVLKVPSDISQITTHGTVVTVQGTGSVVQDASGNNALATLTFVGSGAQRYVHTRDGSHDEHGRHAERHLSQRPTGIDATRSRRNRCEFDQEQRHRRGGGGPDRDGQLHSDG